MEEERELGLSENVKLSSTQHISPTSENPHPESKHMHTIPSVIRHDNFNEVDSFEGLYRIEGPGVLFYFCFLNMSRKTPPLRVFALDNVCQLASPISLIKFRTQLNSGLS